ncbi:MAG: hypothetical protein IT492_23705 [Gammaproteobacteria bacterium]|nr:hypothetical protein [Gammaproteobacteria bacterium]
MNLNEPQTCIAAWQFREYCSRHVQAWRVEDKRCESQPKLLFPQYDNGHAVAERDGIAVADRLTLTYINAISMACH